jgi:hypothetical protein
MSTTICHSFCRFDVQYTQYNKTLEDVMIEESKKVNNFAGTVCKGLYPQEERYVFLPKKEGQPVISCISIYVFVYDLLKKGVVPNFLLEKEIDKISVGEEKVEVKPLRPEEVLQLKQELTFASQYVIAD